MIDVFVQLSILPSPRFLCTPTPARRIDHHFITISSNQALPTLPASSCTLPSTLNQVTRNSGHCYSVSSEKLLVDHAIPYVTEQIYPLVGPTFAYETRPCFPIGNEIYRYVSGPSVPVYDGTYSPQKTQLPHR